MSLIKPYSPATKIVATVASGYKADYYTTGTADDAQIQLALNALPSTGGQVLLKAGTYNFAASASVTYSNTNIVGEGQATILRWASNTNPASLTPLIDTNGSDYLTISQMQIDGNSGNNSTGVGIYINKSTRVWVNHMYIKDLAQHALYAVGTGSGTASHANKYTNIYILNCGGYGYWGKSYTYDCQFNDVWIGTCNVGIRLEESQNFLTNLHVWGSTGNGIEVRNTDNRITNGYIETNGANGIDLFNTSHFVGTNLNLRANVGVGVAASSTNRWIIADSLIYNNGGPGVNVSGTTTNWKVDNCVFLDTQTPKTQTYGVATSSGTSNGTITNNTSKVADHLTGNLNLAGTDHKVFNNDGTNPQAYHASTVTTTLSIDVRNYSVLDATLTGNSTATFFGGQTTSYGQRITVLLRQDSTGGRTVSWPANAKFSTGSAPTLSTTASAVDTISFVWDGTNWRENGRSIQDVTALSVAQGGTGATTLTGILKGNGTSAVTGSATTSDLTEGSNLYYTDARVRANRLDQMAAPTASVNLNSQKITSLTDPSANQDAATKAYVDSVAQGLDAKASVRAATTTAGTLVSSFENGDTVDGVVLATNDRILVKNQVTGRENGIYTVNASGAPTRAADADVDAEVTNGMYCFVTSGTTNANTGWVLTTANPITVDTTALTFAQFSAASTIVAGSGLTLTGSTIDAVGTSNRISVAADSIDISTSYVGQASITTLGTVTSGTWNGTTIAIADGGTGSTTASGARTALGLGTIATQNANNVTISGGSVTGVTDIVVADGGTGVSTLTANAILQGNGTSALTTISPGANGTVLLSNGTTASFATIANSSLTGGTYSAITGVGTLTAGTLGSGFTTVAIGSGGTGQVTKTAAFDALSPLSTQSDLIYHDGTNNVRLAKGTAGQVLTMNGGATAPSWATPSASSNYRTLVSLGSDVASTASTAFQDVTGLSFTATSGTFYRFYGLLLYTASATTIGVKGSVNGPSMTILAYDTRSQLSATGSAANDWVNSAATVNAAALVSSTSSATTTGNILVIEGVFKPSATGTFILRFAPETATAAGITIKAGSTLEYW
jgi:hypothetical protein